MKLEQNWGAKQVAKAIGEELDRRKIDLMWAPDRDLLEACGRETVRHIRRRWRLRRRLFCQEASAWREVLRGLGIHYERSRRGVGGLRMEVQLLEALRMEPGHSEISPVTGGKRRPPALAGGGIDASHWRARWRLATCYRAAWRYAAKGWICEECRTVRCSDICDNCGRELPCEPFGSESLCSDCYEAADAGELLAMDTGGIMDDAEPVLQESIVWETPF
jgi:hypothetical protein